MNNEINPQNKLIVFQGIGIRRAWHNNEWFYSLVDIAGVLTDSANPTDYLKKIRKRDNELGSYLGTNCPQIEMGTVTGKKRKTLAGNTKDALRFIQSVQIMSGVADVSAPWDHTMIVKTDGTLWGCGNNEYGRLGDGTSINRSTPVQILQ